MMNNKEELLKLLEQALHHQEDLLHGARDPGDIEHIQFDIARLKWDEKRLKKNLGYWTDSEIDRLRVLAGEEPQHPLWVLEYGEDYSVPKPLQEMLERHELYDVSNENEACPHFVYNNFYSIWVEHPDISRRKTDSNRFTVTTMDCMGTLLDVVLETDDLPKLMDFLKRNTSSMAV